MPEFEIGFGQRQLQIVLDLLGRHRDRIGIFDKRLHPRCRIRIGPGDIDIGVERTDIISRILVWRVSGFQPVKLALHHVDQIFPFKFFSLAQVCSVDRHRIGNRLFADIDRLFETFFAPVGKLAVKFMLALIDGEIRIDRKISVQKAGEIAAPGARLINLHRRDRFGLDFLASAHGQGGQRYRQQ